MNQKTIQRCTKTVMDSIADLVTEKQLKKEQFDKAEKAYKYAKDEYNEKDFKLSL